MKNEEEAIGGKLCGGREREIDPLMTVQDFSNFLPLSLCFSADGEGLGHESNFHVAQYKTMKY